VLSIADNSSIWTFGPILYKFHDPTELQKPYTILDVQILQNRIGELIFHTMVSDPISSLQALQPHNNNNNNPVENKMLPQEQMPGTAFWEL